MIDRKAKAAELHSNRYTCSQAVACAFCDVVDVDEETMKTSKEGVYAGGDVVTGAATVILAMGAGKKAAQAIDEALKQK